MDDRPTQPGAAFAGAAWMAASTLFFALLAVLTRRLAADHHPFEIAFFRTFFSLLFMLPWLARAGVGALATPQFGLHALRAGVSAVAMFSWFAAMAYMPLAEAVSLNFTAPIFGSLMAVLILRERAGPRRWVAMAGGFLGALLILRPGVQAVSPVALLALTAALTIAMSMLMIKLLTRTDSSNAIITWSAILTTPLTLAGALFVWTTPTLTGLAWLAALGAAARESLARGLSTSCP
jgi:drug/metabolite transporter (DMT)-like permease